MATCTGKSTAAPEEIALLSVRENSALSAGAVSRDSPFTSSRDSIQRSNEAFDTERVLLRAATVTGSDVISFDAPLSPLPEARSSTQHDVAQLQEVELFGSVIRHRGREVVNDERLTQTCRTVTTLVVFSVVILLYLFLTSLTQSLTCQRTGVLLLVVWVTWLCPAALVWISDIQSRLRCVCYCHVTCWRPRH